MEVGKSTYSERQPKSVVAGVEASFDLVPLFEVE